MTTDAPARTPDAAAAITRRRAMIAIVCGVVILCMGMGLRQSFGLFLRPVSADLALGREVFAFAIAIQNIVWGVSQPFAGAIADKYGAGRVIVGGGILYTLGLFLAAGASDPMGLNISLGLLIGLGLSGTTFAVVLGAVGRMVPEKRRGLALGIATAGGSFGMFIFVPAGQALLTEVGWINALVVLAAVATLTVIFSGGLAGKPGGGGERQSLSEAIAEARGHSGYWLLTLGFFVCGFQVTFIAVHLPAFLADEGLSPMVGATALGVIGLCNIISGIMAGVFGDKFRKKFTLSWLYILRGVVISGFLFFPITEVSALVFAAAIGLLWLGTVPLTSGLVVDIFGPRYLSTLFGFVFFSHQVGSFLGAWLGGYVFDLTGSYTPVWLAAIALSVVAALLHMPISDRPVARLAKSTA